MRANVDSFRDVWYQRGQEAEDKPITCGRKCNRTNQPADSVSDYYKCSITIHSLDSNELQQRFDTYNMTAFQTYRTLEYRLKTLLEGEDFMFC